MYFVFGCIGVPDGGLFVKCDSPISLTIISDTKYFRIFIFVASVFRNQSVRVKLLQLLHRKLHLQPQLWICWKQYGLGRGLCVR